MDKDVSRAVIAVLSRSLRETDYIGWYREEHVVGVILTAFRPDSVTDRDNSVRTRVENLLLTALPSKQGCFIKVLLYRHHDEINEAQLT